MAFRDLAHNETTTAAGSGAKPYVLRNLNGVYDCTCTSWRQNTGKIAGHGNIRTCKHLIALRGFDAETKRLGAAPLDEKSPERLAAEGEKGRALRSDEKRALFGPKILSAMRLEAFPDLDPTGWLESEKLDGYFARWDGKNFLSKEGNIFPAPEWFKTGLPTTPFDGELWMGRGGFQKVQSVARSSAENPAWTEMQYVVYDAPEAPGGFEERLASATTIYEQAVFTGARDLSWHVHEHVTCRGRAELLAHLELIVAAGGEGLMIRKPGAAYEIGVSATILKVKKWNDAEGVVVAYTAGKGANKGVTGGLVIEMPDGQRFGINAGKADVRREPPPLGTKVKYRFMAVTDKGLPKGASIADILD